MGSSGNKRELDLQKDLDERARNSVPLGDVLGFGNFSDSDFVNKTHQDFFGIAMDVPAEAIRGAFEAEKIKRQEKIKVAKNEEIVSRQKRVRKQLLTTPGRSINILT